MLRTVTLITTGCLLALACGAPEPEAASGRPASLLEGRTARIEARSPGGGLEPLTLTLGGTIPQDGGAAKTLDQFVIAYCDAQVGNMTRLLAGSLGGLLSGEPTIDEQSLCGWRGLRAQASAICAANVYQTIAESIMPVEFYGFEASPAAALFVVRHEGDDPLAGVPPVNNPPPDVPLYRFVAAEDTETQGTFALLAVEYFRGAALIGANALDPSTCPDGTLIGTAPAERNADGSWNIEERITIAELIARGTAEGAYSMESAAGLAERLIAATADDRLAWDRDATRAIRESWAARHGSRLEIANMWTGVPVMRFISEEGASAFGEIATCQPDDPAGAGGDVEERLVRETGINPIQAPDALQEALRDALLADYPAVFEGLGGMSMSAPEFLGELGLSPQRVVAGANRIAEEAAVHGRPIVEGEIRGGVPRVNGTSEASAPTEGAYLYANTVGSMTFDVTSGSNGRPTDTYGFNGPPGGSTEGDTDYAWSSVVATMDTVAAAVVYTAVRADVPPSVAPVLEQLHTALRERVDGRLEVCIGATSATEPTSIGLRLFGDDLTAERVELWWGEEGLRCAIDGNLYGVPCDLSEVRIAEPPVVGPGEESGFNSSVLWDLKAAELPGAPSAIPNNQRLYVSVWDGPDRNRRIVVAALTTDPGPSGDPENECYRVTRTPTGAEVMTELERALAASPSDCTRPATSCAGVPFDQRLPLEDEISEAGEGRDDIESSFLHYLRLAEAAALESDMLADEIIRSGLEMDLRAESAADELQALCGVPVSASDFPADPPGDPCVVDADCCRTDTDSGTPVCGTAAGYRCQLDHCIPSDITAYIAENDVGSEALRRCLGSADEPLVPVSLGSSTWYLFRGFDGDLCSTYDFGPRGVPNLTGECPNRSRVPLEVIEGHPPLRILRADPLNLVTAETVLAVPNCEQWARLVSGMPPPSRYAGDASAFLADIIQQDWFSYGALATTAATMTYEGGPFETGGVLLNGAPFATLGTATAGPQPADRWPCAPWPGTAIDCATPPSGLVPLRCGGSCNTPAARRALATRFVRGIEALQGLSQGPVIPATGAHGLPTPLSGLGIDARWVEAVGEASAYCDAAGLPADCLDGGARLYGSDAGRVCISGPGAASSPVNALFGVCPYATIANNYSAAYFPESVGGLSEDDFNRLLSGGSVYEHLLAWVDGDLALNDRSPIGPGRIDQSFTDGDRPYLGRNGRDLRGLTHYPALHGGDPYYTSVEETLLALELVCMAVASGPGGCENGEPFPPIEGLEDLSRLAERLRCQADSIESSIDRLVLLDLPESIVSDLRNSALTPSYPATRGAYGEAIAQLRSALEELPAAIRVVAGGLRAFAGEVAVARSRVRITDLSREIRQWQLVADIANETARCVASSGDKPWSTAATCAASAVGIISAVANAVLSEEISDEETRIVLAGTGVSFGEALDRIENARTQIVQSYATINGILAELDSQRSQARALAARVLFLDSDATGREFEATRVYRARMNTLQDRYLRAHERSIRMAYLARRAIEQRFGVNLSEMRDDMTLVPPPATWADGLCAMRGVDYSEVRGSDDDPGLDDYSDRYVGDYVNLLEDFIESYRLDFPFQDGDDVALISLRDDLRRVREPTDAESYNLFLGTESPSGSADWLSDCAAEERCVVAFDHPSAAFREERDGRPGDPGYSTFLRTTGEGASVTLASLCPEPDRNPDGSCPHTSSGVLGQAVELDVGREYLVSWYEERPETLATAALISANTDMTCVTDCTGGGGTPEFCADRCLNVNGLQGSCAAAAAVGPSRLVVSFNPGSAVSLAAMGAVNWIDPGSDRWIDACNWQRYFVRLRALEAGPVLVGFEPLAAMPADEPQVGWAMPQLELVPLGAGSVSVSPAPFMRTDDDRIVTGVALGVDTDGSTFRTGAHWRRGCEYLCPDGLGSTCAGEHAPDRSLLRCYWETEFDISVDAIERGDLLPTGGFAVGNYNYRFRDFAINVVGSGVRDCSTADSPTSCYSSGYIPYSLFHDGPFHVRNHVGELLEAPLFNGRVHFARALAAERYLTNPVSAADRGLLEDYFRREFRGRPVDGHYRLRLYETDGFTWERVEDVQIILNYRYWTRFE